MVEKNDRTPRMSCSLWYTVTFILCTFALRAIRLRPRFRSRHRRPNLLAGSCV